MSSYGELEIRSNSKFLKIESGIPHDIRLLSGSPTVKDMHGFGKEAVECDGEGCAQCADPQADEVRQRFSAHVYDFTVKRALTWEFGATIAKQLKGIDNTLKEEGKKITDVDLKVEASGEKMQKKYSVIPRMTSKPLPADIEIPF